MLGASPRCVYPLASYTQTLSNEAYADQDKLGVQLKRGHSKDHRLDLNQLVYNICVSRNGAIPIHFECYDGNRSDEGIQIEIWNKMRFLLQRPGGALGEVLEAQIILS